MQRKGTPARKWSRCQILTSGITLPTEFVFDVRMLHMLTDSVIAATVALLVSKLEGTTFVRVKIIYYHDMLPYPLPIHLCKHQNMIYLFNSPCIFLNCFKTYCLRFVWIPYGGWHFETNHALWFLRHINRFIYVAHFSVKQCSELLFTGLNSHMYLLWISEFYSIKL